MKGGAVEPGFTGTIGTAGPVWSGTSTAGPYSSATGQPIPDPYSSQSGGRRRKSKALANALRELKKGGKRTAKKGSKKTRLTRRMKGGASQYLPGGASAGFTGAGAARGMGGYQDVGTPRANGVLSA